MSGSPVDTSPHTLSSRRSSLTLVMEKAVELLHDGCLHDLPEEDTLLLQLLGAEVLAVACGPLVIVE